MALTTKSSYTISEAAELFKVSRQRMYQLFEMHGVKITKVNSRLNLVESEELKKIPRKRPTGIKLNNDS